MTDGIDRREFITTAFSAASVAALSGTTIAWPDRAQARPVAEPIEVQWEGDFLTDPNFDFKALQFPTQRERLGLEGLDAVDLKAELDVYFIEIEHLVADHDNWSIEEIEWWLDSEAGHEDLDRWQLAYYCQYGVGLDIYNRFSPEEAISLGLELVEGDQPCGDFVGVFFEGDVAELNRRLVQLGRSHIVVSG